MEKSKQFYEDFKNWTGKDIENLSESEQTKIINRSRNYIRFRIAKSEEHYVSSQHPLLTEDEKNLIKTINRLEDQLALARCQFFADFYDNCPKVGSTLKRKPKPQPKGMVTINNVDDFI
jgi:hypothetical protein